MKKIILLVSTLFLVLFIYLKNTDNKIYYLALGDSFALGVNPYNVSDYGYTDYVKEYFQKNGKLEKYITDFSHNGYRTIDLIRDIEDNKMVVIDGEKIYLKQALIKADLVTLSIGTNDISSMITFSTDKVYIDDAFSDMDILLRRIREYCKETIVAVGYFSASKNNVYEYANQRYKELCDRYDIIYIDIYDILSDSKYFPNPNNFHPSKEGYKIIGEKIINSLNSLSF